MQRLLVSATKRPEFRQLLLDMLVQPIPFQVHPAHLARAHDLPQARRFAAKAFKRLRHLPLRARVEKRQHVPLLQVAVPGHPHLHLRRVVFQRRVARVVDVEEIGVEVDVATRGRFDRGPCAFFDEEVARDGREGSAGREGDERGGVRIVGAGDVVDLDEVGMARLLPCRGVGGNGHHWSLIDLYSLVDEWPRLCWGLS